MSTRGSYSSSRETASPSAGCALTYLGENRDATTWIVDRDGEAVRLWLVPRSAIREFLRRVAPRMDLWAPDPMRAGALLALLDRYDLRDVAAGGVRAR